MKKLLILDINGLLYDKRLKNNTFDTSNFETIETKSFIIYIRPFIINFLDNCSEIFDIALWTSANYYNVIDFIKWLTPKLKFSFKFIWYRDRCEIDTRSNILFDVVKNSRTLILSPILNSERLYNEDNIIFIDDDINKVNINKNFYICKTFDVSVEENSTEELLKIYDDLINM